MKHRRLLGITEKYKHYENLGQQSINRENENIESIFLEYEKKVQITFLKELLILKI
jgi:hypothetical protein